MITIRFPSGLSITYNNANYLYRELTKTVLYTKSVEEGGKFVAQVLGDHVVEFEGPCKIENVGIDLSDGKALEIVAQKIRKFKNGQASKLAEIKAALRDFDARTLSWK
jgi:hypothetical protein